MVTEEINDNTAIQVTRVRFLCCAGLFEFNSTYAEKRFY